MPDGAGAHSSIRAGSALDRAAYAELRRTMELCHRKWDAQIGDVTALAPFPLLLSPATWTELAGLAERLAAELVAAEQEVLGRPELLGQLGLPRALRRLFAGGAAGRLSPGAGRVMRFDFHCTTEGLRISEVNSDVPGGYTEATELGALVAPHVPGARLPGDPAGALVEAIVGAAGEGSTVALVSAPGHMEDHQVVAYLAARLQGRGAVAHCASPHHLRFRGGRAHLEAAFFRGPVGAVVRFYQVEWLCALPGAVEWAPLLVGGETPVVNPPVAALGESKRFALLRGELRAPMDTWRRLLPETRPLGRAPWPVDDGWILKSAYCNIGDTVTVRGRRPSWRWARRAAAACCSPGRWVAQRRFEVVPVETPRGPMYPCIGVYTVDGRAAGAYGRLGVGPVIDFSATDVAVLVQAEVSP